MISIYKRIKLFFYIKNCVQYLTMIITDILYSLSLSQHCMKSSLLLLLNHYECLYFSSISYHQIIILISFSQCQTRFTSFRAACNTVHREHCICCLILNTCSLNWKYITQSLYNISPLHDMELLFREL